MSSKHKQNTIVQLSDREHVLKRPNRYIGMVKPTEYEDYFFNFETGKMEYEKLNYSAGLLKCISEVIDNAVDECIRTNFEIANKIEIKINNGEISIKDNGRGIPLDSFIIAWTALRTGSNFEDEDDNTTMGQNGEGATLANIFSILFKGKTITMEGDRGILTCNDNMTKVDSKIDKALKSEVHGTTVDFIPDYEKFGMETFDEIHQRVLYTRLVNLAISYPNITFIFNGKTIKANSFSDYVKLYSSISTTFSVNNLDVAVFPSPESKSVHYINGLKVKEGAPLKWVMDNTIDKLTDRTKKGYSKIDKSSIKNKLGFIVIFREMTNPRFGDQIKSVCVNTWTEFKDTIGVPNYIDFAERIYKNKGVMDPILELYRIQQEMEKRKLMGSLKADDSKEKFNPKLLKATEVNKFLMVAEGDSATSSLPEVFGRSEIGYLPLMGKLMNSLKSKPSVIKNNKRAEDLIEAFGIGLDETRYEKIISATDADLDGIHIKTLMIAMFYVLDRRVLEEQRFYQLNTPVMVITDKSDKVVDWYYTLADYQANQSNIKAGTKHTYMKGLGSWSPENLKVVVAKDGLDRMLEVISFNPETDGVIIERWLSDQGIDYRKSVLEKKSFDISNI